MTEALESAMSELIADRRRCITAPGVVERLSKDFYWYSPVLKKRLENKHAEVVVQPVNTDEVRSILRHCFAHDIPVTPRGAGTGNYGQAIPLDGGVILDLSLMDRIEAITGDGVAICEPGVRLGVLETQARSSGLGTALLSEHDCQSFGRWIFGRRLRRRGVCTQRESARL